MGHPTLVWVSKAGVKEVDGAQEFVEVDSDLAAKLIKEGKAQDPAHGALHLDPVEPAQPVKASKRSKKAIAQQDIETKD